MFDEILFPTDGSDGASVAFDHVLDLAAGHDATVHVLNVADTTRDSVVQIQGEVVDALEQEGQDIVDEATERARGQQIDVVTEVLQGEPYTTIVDYAETYGLDLVVMPTHGRQGLSRVLLGSTTERVVRQSDVPVLTIRPDEDFAATYPYQNVLVPTDGSACADEALSVGVDVAHADDAALHLLSVVDIAVLGIDVRTDIQVDFLEESAETILDDAATVARTSGIESVSETIEYGTSIHRTVLSYVEDHDVDIVVVGTHGRTGFDRYVLGSVAESLVRTAPVPVLTVRGPVAES